MDIKQIKTQAELLDLNFDSIEPFTLSLQGEELFCQRILRVMPKKRIVVEAVWRETKVIAKLFFAQDKASQHYQRELMGFDLLKKAEIKVPTLLFSGQLQSSKNCTSSTSKALDEMEASELSVFDSKEVYAVIFQELYPRKTIADFYDDTNALSEYLKQLQSIFIQMHDHNIIQQDPHPDNFLIVGDEIYTIDSSSVIECKDKKRQAQNMTLFYAQLPARFAGAIKTLFREYCEARNLPAEEYGAYASRWLFEACWRRGNQFIKKCLRNSSKFVSHKTNKQLAVYDRQYHSKAFADFVNSSDKGIEHAEILKAGNTSTVYKIEIDGKPFVVKRYNNKSTLHFLKHMFRKSRAFKSWCYANLLTLFGVRTPAPVAFIEEYCAGFRKKAYFVSAYVEGERLLEAFPENHQRLAVRTRQLFAELSYLQISHGDMKATNFLVNNDRVYVMDLDAMHFHESCGSWESAWKKDMRRFERNWKTSLV